MTSLCAEKNRIVAVSPSWSVSCESRAPPPMFTHSSSVCLESCIYPNGLCLGRPCKWCLSLGCWPGSQQALLLASVGWGTCPCPLAPSHSGPAHVSSPRLAPEAVSLLSTARHCPCDVTGSGAGLWDVSECGAPVWPARLAGPFQPVLLCHMPSAAPWAARAPCSCSSSWTKGTAAPRPRPATCLHTIPLRACQSRGRAQSSSWACSAAHPKSLAPHLW